MEGKEQLVKIIEEYEEKLINEFGYLKYNTDPFDKDSLKAFLKSFFKYDTLSKYEDIRDLQGCCSSEKNYYSTNRGRSRSIGDLFLIAKYHYSNEVKLIDVMREVYDILENDSLIEFDSPDKYIYHMHTYICPDIRKRVFWIHYSSGYPGTYKFTKNTAGEAGYSQENEFSFTRLNYVELFSEDLSVNKAEGRDEL